MNAFELLRARKADTAPIARPFVVVTSDATVPASKINQHLSATDSGETTPAATPVVPAFCRWECRARVDGGCMVWGTRWVPFSRMAACPKARLFGCHDCEHHERGWCLHARQGSRTSIDFLGACPKVPVVTRSTGEPWNYDSFARASGCYGCNFFTSGYGEIHCGYDRQARMETNQAPCPLNALDNEVPA